MKQAFDILVFLLVCGLAIGGLLLSRQVARLNRDVDDLRSAQTARIQAKQAAEELRKDYDACTNQIPIALMRQVKNAIALGNYDDPTAATVKIQEARTDLDAFKSQRPTLTDQPRLQSSQR